MIRFIIESYSFKRIIILTVIFIGITFLFNKLFDVAWGSNSSIPIINLGDVYKTPLWYDNYPRINLKLVSREQLAIESNKMFKIKDSPKIFGYYDTVIIKYPESSFDNVNNIYFQFRDSNYPDSLSLVVSKSDDPKIYYKQIFNSSVFVNKLNDLSPEPEKFRIKSEDLVSTELLIDNDSLINAVFKYFNDNKDNLGLAECGTNGAIFRSICGQFNLPCRLISLQGGDADQAGYYNYIGYPLHAVCEIYSSKYRKWYVVDPSFGFRFRHNKSDDYLSAVEISNMYTFHRDNEIVQDSVLFTKRTVVGRDYFKYYENIYYTVGIKPRPVRAMLRVFYARFDFFLYHYSNYYPPSKDGLYYVGIKSFMYFFLLILYINSIMFIIIKRLIAVKKPKKS